MIVVLVYNYIFQSEVFVVEKILDVKRVDYDTKAVANAQNCQGSCGGGCGNTTGGGGPCGGNK